MLTQYGIGFPVTEPSFLVNNRWAVLNAHPVRDNDTLRTTTFAISSMALS
jgi:hypothetical protein